MRNNLRQNIQERQKMCLPSLSLAQLILQPLHHFTYIKPHSPTLPLLHLRHSSFSNSSVASPTSQLILQPFFRFSYVTVSSLTSPGEPPMHISYVSYKIYAKYCGRHWQKKKVLIDCHKCSSSFLSIVKSHPLKIPASLPEKVRAGSCLKLFLIDCRRKTPSIWKPKFKYWTCFLNHYVHYLSTFCIHVI